MKQTLNIKILLSALLAGVLAWIVDIALYYILQDSVSRVILTGIMFAVLTLFVSVAIIIASIAGGSFDEEFFFLQSKTAIIVGLVIMSVSMFLLASLFDWIYGLNGNTSIPSSYVFLLDESNSMEINDSERRRYTAITDVMQDRAEPFSIYCFAETASQYREMKPYDSEETGEWENWNVNEGGGTLLLDALHLVLHDLTSGELSGGTSPRVILLTDGVAYDTDDIGSELIDDLIYNYREAGISISTVGLGNFNYDVLIKLAEETDGKFVSAEDSDSIEECMLTAAQRTERHLLSPRDMAEHNVFYGFLRILFLALLGVWHAIAKAMACAQMGEEWKTIGICSAISLVGAIGLEFAINILPEALCILLLWVLMSVILVEHVFNLGRGVNIEGFFGNKTHSMDSKNKITFR